MNLPRRTPLARGPGIKRTAMRAKPTLRHTAYAAELDAMRALVHRRSTGRCEARCDDACTTTASQVHHRLLRSQGGANEEANLLGVCDHCHAVIHAHPARAYAHGWLVPSWGDPAAVPVLPG